MPYQCNWPGCEEKFSRSRSLEAHEQSVLNSASASAFASADLIFGTITALTQMRDPINVTTWAVTSDTLPKTPSQHTNGLFSILRLRPPLYLFIAIIGPTRMRSAIDVIIRAVIRDSTGNIS